MAIRAHIPNLLSLTNALFGALGVYFAITHSILAAVICMGVCVVADFLDGFMARKLNAFSPLGKDLDSLADVISFGVAPATMMCVALTAINYPFPYISFLIVSASAYRLAKFNNDTRQSVSFIGLPTPANALFWAGLSYWVATHTELIAALPRMISYKVFVLWPVLIVLFSWLLISEVPMFSLKSGLSLRNKPLLWVVVTAIISLPLMGISGLAPTFAIYVCANLIAHYRRRP